MPFDCQVCDGTGWVCENCGTRWELLQGGTCCSAGKNCVCNPHGDMDWDHIFASSESHSLAKGETHE